MMKFYDILLDKSRQVSVPVALKNAQNWLRNLTVQEYINQLSSCRQIIDQAKQKLTSKALRQLMDLIEDEQYRIQNLHLDYKLFREPFYWAAFTAIGV